MSTPQPVDVICVCQADGSIRPLRLRLENEENMMVRVDVEEVLSTRKVDFVGVEALIFLCRIHLCGRAKVIELKYTFRNHSWWLCRQMY